MSNNILVKGKGNIAKITVDAINGYDPFRNNKNKKLFITILKDVADENVCLIAYTVVNGAAHFIVKGENASAVDKYTETVCFRFGNEYDGEGVDYGYPFRPGFIRQNIKGDDLIDAVGYVHSLSPCNPAEYKYNSYHYILKGNAGATAVIIAENGGEISREEYLARLGQGSVKKYKASRSGKEKMSKVIGEANKRYLCGKNYGENAVVFVLAEICDRCKVGYKKAARAMGISYKKQPEMMIATICEMMERRKRDFFTAVRIMKLDKEDHNVLLLNCVVELNRVENYSYDHIVTVLGISDPFYDIIVEVFRTLHRLYGYKFEELCVKFHLQNDIISIRQRCEF